VIGERGAICRAGSANAWIGPCSVARLPILILDEALSSVDAENEPSFRKPSTDGKGRTTLCWRIGCRA